MAGKRRPRPSPATKPGGKPRPTKATGSTIRTNTLPGRMPPYLRKKPKPTKVKRPVKGRITRPGRK